jgi:hypothetical protein
VTKHFIFYDRISHPGSGFKFECDADGVINEAVLTNNQRTNLANCRQNKWQEFKNPKFITEESTTSN